MRAPDGEDDGVAAGVRDGDAPVDSVAVGVADADRLAADTRRTALLYCQCSRVAWREEKE